jgi:sugar lactone lactonase YvrE
MARFWRCVVLTLGVTTALGCETPPVDGTSPLTAAINADDRLWVTDRGAGQVLSFHLSGKLEGVVVDGLDRPSSARIGPDGAVYVASFGEADVLRFDGANEERFYSDAIIEEPVELQFRDGELFVLGNDTRNTIVIDADGRMVNEIHPVAKDAHDFAFGPDGLLYIASSTRGDGLGTVQAWDPDTGERVADFVPDEEVPNATSIAFDDDGTLVVADYAGSRLLRYEPTTGELLGAHPHVALSRPIDIAFGPEGRLYVVDAYGISRWRSDLSGPEELIVEIGELLVRPRTLTFVR